MARQRFLIAYDICDDRRLRKVCALMKGVGTRLQYSVFLCDLSERELLLWQTDIRRIMELDVDSVVYVELGSSATQRVNVIGAPRRFPPDGPMIV